MAKIKHIAIATQDPDKTAKFYIEVFGLREIAKINSPGALGYHLTDGDINLAILKFKNDQTAGVSEATVFTYFASKRELCIQVITRWYDEISSELERDVPALPGVHAKLSHVVRAHLVTLLADGSGMCALVLGEGRAAGSAEPELAEVIAACKRRYTAPLMDALAEAQVQGQVRADMPLRLLRELVYGSMEHVLWDAITSAKRPDIDTTATQLTELIWSALVPREAALASLAALSRFHDEVHDALSRVPPPPLPPLQA